MFVSIRATSWCVALQLVLGCLSSAELCCAQQPSSSTPPAATEASSGAVTLRELYQEAAEHIARSRFADAIRPLREIVDAGPVSAQGVEEIYETALVYLAESYIRTSQPELALEQLAAMPTPSSPRNQTQQALIERAGALELYALQRVAQIAETSGDWPKSLKYLGLAMEQDPGRASQFKREISRVATRACLQALEQQRSPVAELEALSRQAPELQLLESSILLSLAEQLYLQNNLPDALAVYEQLEQIKRSPGDTAWRPLVSLRRAELHFRSKDYARSKEICLTAKENFPSYSGRAEFDFLMARCAIARIQFDEALGHLQSIAASGAEAPTQAKARWLEGEVYFLQRNYARAIATYQEVLRSGHQPWSHRAALQRAKCLELIGEPEKALMAYRELAAANAKASPDIMAQAQQRVAALVSKDPQNTVTK